MYINQQIWQQIWQGLMDIGGGGVMFMLHRTYIRKLSDNGSVK